MRMRTWTKRALLGALTAGTSLVIAACYGAYYGMRTLVEGTVTGDGQGIPGLRVCADVPNGLQGCSTTGDGGAYWVDVPDDQMGTASTRGFVVRVTDVDGEANGSWAPLEHAVPAEAVPGDGDIVHLNLQVQARGQEGEGEGELDGGVPADSGLDAQ